MITLRKTVALLAVVLIWLLAAACTAETAPSAAENAAAPSATTTVQVSPTAAVVDASPTAEPTVAPTAVPTEAPTESDNFIAALQSALTNRDFDAAQSQMSDPIAWGGYRSEWQQLSPDAARMQLEQWLPATASVQFSPPETDLTMMLDGQNPAMMLGGDVVVTAVIHSTGWGSTGADEAILFVEEVADGRFVWRAMLYALDGFLPEVGDLPVIDEQPAPVGLLYSKVDGSLWQVDANGQPVQLWYQEGVVPTPSPDGKHAFYQVQGDLWLVDLVSGDSRLLTSDRENSDLPNTHLVGYHTWVNNETILSGVLLDPETEGGPNFGHPALIDIATGDVTIVDEARLMSGYPAVSAAGEIAYNVVPQSATDTAFSWIFSPETGLTQFNPAEYADAPAGATIAPAWSPNNGQYIAWIISDGMTGQLVVFDLRSAVVFPGFGLAPFGGAIPNPIFSPDASHIALRQFTNDPQTTGLWLYALNGQPPLFIAQNGGESLWVDNDTLLFIQYDENFNATLQQYSVSNGVRSVVTLPEVFQIFGVVTP